MLTDAALKTLLQEYRAARTAFENDKATLDNAEAALAQGLGAGTELIVRGFRIRVSVDGLHIAVEPLRVVA